MHRGEHDESSNQLPDANPVPPAPQGPDATLSCLYVQHPKMKSVPLDKDISLAALAEESELPEAEDLAHVALAQDMKKLSMSPGIADRFFGQARFVSTHS